MKKGFILLTTLLIITAIGFLSLAQLSLGIVSGKLTEEYYQSYKIIYDQESQNSYNLWLAAQQ